MKYWVNSLTILTAFLLGACSPAEKQIVFALKPDKDPDRMMEEKASLEDYLSEHTGEKVKAITPLSGSVILEGFANGTVDLGYISATEMVYARDAESAEILLAGEIDGKTSYSSYWVSLKDKPYTSVADLKGKPIAFSSRTSTSGFLVPYWDLHEKKLLTKGASPEEFFGKGNVYYGVGYVSAIEQVLSGAAEAAAVSYYVLDQDRHLSLEQRQKLKMMAEQGPVPTHVIAVRSTLDPEEKTRIKAALLELNKEENQELRDKLFTSKLVEVDTDKHLETIAQAIDLAHQMKP